MASKHYDQMSMDELIAAKQVMKNEMNAIKKEYRHAHTFLKTKIHESHVVEAVKQLTRAGEAAGRSVEDQAKYWLGNGDEGQKAQGRLFLTGKTRE